MKLLHVVDEFTREALAIECRRQIGANHPVTVLDRLVAERGTAPAYVRSDDGPKLTANALRDWRRFPSSGREHRPGLARQDSEVESFGCRRRDELLAVEPFSCVAETKVVIED